MKKTKEKRGITLIALIITIIVLLILAGVTISMVVGDNGVLTQAQKASIETNIASEKEAIEFNMVDIAGDLIEGKEVPEEKYIGEELSEMKSVVEGDWKNVIVGDKVYKEGWYLLEKGKEISNYGKTKNSWLVNYGTGELINLEEGNYKIASAGASGAIIDNTLKLNIDPSNLQDKDNWGDGVSFNSGEDGEIDKSGVKKTEIKFDGKDDYLRIDNVNVDKTEGITFEFYGIGKNEKEEFSLLSKLRFENEKIYEHGTGFRTFLNPSYLKCCFGTIDSGSKFKESEKVTHIILFKEIKLDGSNENYVTITIDFNDSKIKVYKDGNLKQETTCTKKYLDSGALFKNDYSFVVGAASFTGDTGGYVKYYNFDLYSCRLYTRILSDDEIKSNYTATKDYHDELVKLNK